LAAAALTLNCTAIPCSVGAPVAQVNDVLATGVVVKSVLAVLESIKFVVSAALHVDEDVQLPDAVESKYAISYNIYVLFKA
jgi:hypothetical protein